MGRFTVSVWGVGWGEHVCGGGGWGVGVGRVALPGGVGGGGSANSPPDSCVHEPPL